jgi:hypothetical protein
MKKSYLDGLYASGSATGFYAPAGGPFNSDLTTWKAISDRGEPVRPDALAAGRELTGFHSWMGLSGPPLPISVPRHKLLRADDGEFVLRTRYGEESCSRGPSGNFSPCIQPADR